MRLTALAAAMRDVLFTSSVPLLRGATPPPPPPGLAQGASPALAALSRQSNRTACPGVLPPSLGTPFLPGARAAGPRRAIRRLSHATSAVVSMAMPTPTVEPAWLLENLDQVKVLDASWYMPAEKRNPFQEFQSSRIPGAEFFDIDKISDTTSSLPHMLPTAEAFSAAASALGLSNSDNIVVYDGKGIFAAARAWWMFRVFGHEAVSVLEGGLPLWQSQGLPLEIAPSEEAETRHRASLEAVADAYGGRGAAAAGGFKAAFRPELVLSQKEVLANIESKGFQLVDARSAGRFAGTDPEPRAGLSSGSVPGSFNVPFPKVLNKEGTLLCPVELETVFQEAGLDLAPSQKIAASCGTGVTATVLALALHRLGRKDVPVYDGSWTEWASTAGVPIAKKQLA